MIRDFLVKNTNTQKLIIAPKHWNIIYSECLLKFFLLLSSRTLNVQVLLRNQVQLTAIENENNREIVRLMPKCFKIRRSEPSTKKPTAPTTKNLIKCEERILSKDTIFIIFSYSKGCSIQNSFCLDGLLSQVLIQLTLVSMKPFLVQLPR